VLVDCTALFHQRVLLGLWKGRYDVQTFVEISCVEPLNRPALPRFVKVQRSSESVHMMKWFLDDDECYKGLPDIIGFTEFHTRTCRTPYMYTSIVLGCYTRHRNYDLVDFAWQSSVCRFKQLQTDYA